MFVYDIIYFFTDTLVGQIILLYIAIRMLIWILRIVFDCIKAIFRAFFRRPKEEKSKKTRIAEMYKVRPFALPFARRTSIECLRNQFLDRNSEFISTILDRVLSRKSGCPWIIEQDKFQQKLCSVFIGVSDIHVFQGCPTTGIGDDAEPWPHTFHIVSGHTYHYTFFSTDYFKLSFPPITEYSNRDIHAKADKFGVLMWIAQEVQSEFRSLHPEFTVSEVGITFFGEDAYCHFTYKTSQSQLTGWK